MDALNKMKREKSITAIKKAFEQIIQNIENSNNSKFSLSNYSQENGIKFLKIQIELE